MGERSIAADGPRADDGRGAAVPVRRDLQDGQHAGDGDGRGDRGDLLRRAGSSASRRSRSTATTARSASRCPTADRAKDAAADKVGRGRRGRRSRRSSSTARSASGCRRAGPSQTTSFSVGGAEGYLTAGSYPDDGLGEVFLKFGKQGSTLAGVMDAFSIAISIGLQYGVPLETFVEKFTNMRFEPAGMTDDPDVRMAQSVMDYVFRRLALDYLRLRRPGRSWASTPPTSALASSRPARTRPPSRRRVGRGRSRTSWRPSASRPRSPKPAAAGARPRRRRGRGQGSSTPTSVKSGAGAASAREVSVEVHSSAELLEKFQGICRRRADVHDLRHEDAPRRLLLRLRRLRKHQRLQLTVSQHRGPGRIALRSGPCCEATCVQVVVVVHRAFRRESAAAADYVLSTQEGDIRRAKVV